MRPSSYEELATGIVLFHLISRLEGREKLELNSTVLQKFWGKNYL